MITLFWCIRRLAKMKTDLFVSKRIKKSGTAHGCVHELVGKIKSIKDKLLGRFPEEKDTLDNYTEHTLAEYMEEEEIKMEKELRPINAFLDKRAIINTTNEHIPEDVQLVLSFGPKFCFYPGDDHRVILDFLAYAMLQLEMVFPVETHLEICKQMSIELTRHKKEIPTYTDIWLEFLKYRTENFLKTNRDILVIRSDKGKHTVVITKENYMNKLQKFVDESKDYLRCDNLNIEDLAAKNNGFVSKMLTQGIIGEEKKWLYEETCTQMAKLYGLIKVHKENYPIRPIISSIGMVGYGLAKFCLKILEGTFPEEGCHIKNSVNFVKDLERIYMEEDDIMISFDVVSMFPSISLDLMFELISERSREIETKFGISFEFLKEILNFVLRECAIFQFNEVTYRQTDSLAMGSPLSPMLARILMTKILEYTLARLTLPPKKIALYVDDSFWIAKRSQVEYILNVLNSFHHRIKFTCEKEENGAINFLDITLIRKHNEIIYRWYKKPYASFRLLNYFSSHEKTCIIETAVAFVKSILKLSHPVFFRSNKVLLEEILRCNSFPEDLILGIISKNYTLMKKPELKNKFSGRYIPIRYHGAMTGRLKDKLKSFLGTNRFVGIPNRIGTKIFSKIKDRTPLGLKTNVIIFFECKCKRLLAIRHTKFRNTAADILLSMEKELPSEGEQCLSDSHVFGTIKHIQGKNYGLMSKLYGLYTFFHRKKLFKTKMVVPHFYLDKHITK